MNYSRGKPVGNNSIPQYDSPAPYVALEQYLGENATASSVITLTQDTTAVEVGTGGTGAVIKWIAVSDTTASVIAVAGSTGNFDHFIPANTVRRFVIPIESNPATGYSSVQGANRENGLYQRLAVKTQGIASVLVSEY